MKTILYTLIALIAFAGNSVLCRLALGDEVIDAASFTAIRLFSGVAVLALILSFTQARSEKSSKGSWLASIMLFVYATAFSFAYISVDTGTGALILFGFVQITMIFIGIYQGNRLHLVEWLGVILAFSGLIYLLMPGLNAPPIGGFLLMMAAGIAWGFYSILGKGSKSPLRDTGYNFYRTLPFAALLMLLFIDDVSLSTLGITLAILSGAIASGVGYTIWYIALRGLSSAQAAVVQLLVPLIAALGGVIFVDEIFSLRLGISSFLTLGGVFIVLFSRQISNFSKTD